jgi:uncharacterized protein (TIGR02391 family)
MKKNQPIKRSANLSYEEMNYAIQKIERRIQDLNNFDVNSVIKQFSPEVKALETKLEQFLSDLYPPETAEYDKYNWSLTNIDCQVINLMYETPLQEVRHDITENIARATSVLEAIKSHFLETLEDAGILGSVKPIKAYEGLELHPAIAKASSNLYKDGHYANAVEDAVKALNALVRLNSGVEDKDGIQLMESVFSPKNPILKVNNLSDQSDIDEQKGFMNLFSGAVCGLRNPRAHKIIKDDAEMALEFIAFISLLAKFVDRSIKTN